jgi:hypothetical protein
MKLLGLALVCFVAICGVVLESAKEPFVPSGPSTVALQSPASPQSSFDQDQVLADLLKIERDIVTKMGHRRPDNLSGYDSGMLTDSPTRDLCTSCEGWGLSNPHWNGPDRRKCDSCEGTGLSEARRTARPPPTKDRPNRTVAR